MANKLIIFERLQRYDEKIKAFIKAQIDVVTSALSSHSSDKVLHITSEERAKWNGKAEASAIPTKLSQLTNDCDYKTTDSNTTYTLTQDKIDGHKITLTSSTGEAMSITVPNDGTLYDDSAVKADIAALKSGKADKSEIPAYTNATSAQAGLMSAEDKNKLDKLSDGGLKTASGTIVFKARTSRTGIYNFCDIGFTPKLVLIGTVSCSEGQLDNVKAYHHYSSNSWIAMITETTPAMAQGSFTSTDITFEIKENGFRYQEILYDMGSTRTHSVIHFFAIG